MDWVAVWTAVAALAAWVAALGALGALLAITLQLQQDRTDRETDYFRKLTPFLSFEVLSGQASDSAPAVFVYADGGGYAFNVMANIDQTNASTGGGGQLVGQTVLRYHREGRPKPIWFSPKAAEGYQGVLRVTFVDTFGVHHEAQQAVRFGAGDKLDTTDAIRWACGVDCHVHVIRAGPPPGVLPRLARRLRLY